MATTFSQSFTDKVTVIATAWLNGVNSVLNILENVEDLTAADEDKILRVNSAGIVEANATILDASATWDPASLTTGSSAEQTITVTGAALGDVAYAGHTSIDEAGWDISAYVSAADTVNVRITNNSGGTIDLASGTLKVVVIKI